MLPIDYRQCWSPGHREFVERVEAALRAVEHPIAEELRPVVDDAIAVLVEGEHRIRVGS